MKFRKMKTFPALFSALALTACGASGTPALPDTAAEKAGVKAGDIIQKVGGKKVNSPHEMLLAVTSFKPGDKIHLDAKRGDKDITFDIVAGKRDTNALYSKHSTRGSKLGLELLEKDGRVSVEEILPNGAVDAANTKNDNGIREGDFIIEVNRMPVRSVDDVIAAMKASHNNTVVFLIERKVRGDQPRRFFVAIPIK